MKKLIPTIITTLILLAVTWMPCQAEVTTYACVKKINGQMRFVTDPCDCNPSENVISWTATGSEKASNIVIYVSPGGEDSSIDPERGLLPEKPFKTINYAIGRVPSLRSSPDVLAIVAILKGTYLEAVSIQLNKILLFGAEGKDITKIENPDDLTDTISIIGSSNVGVSGVTVLNGTNGIFLGNASSAYVQNTSVQDTADYGINVNLGSQLHLSDCSVTNSGIDGIGAYMRSQISFLGNITSSMNGRCGIAIHGSSNAFSIAGTEITTTENDVGILVTLASSIHFIASKIMAEENGLGMSAQLNSTFLSELNSEFSIANNTGGGLLLNTSSSTVFSGGSVNVNNNGGWGISVGSSHLGIMGCNLNSTYNSEDGLGIWSGSNVDLGGSTVTIENNKQHGVNIFGNGSLANLSPGCKLIIQHNDSHGIILSHAGYARLINGETTILNNSAFDLGVYSMSQFISSEATEPPGGPFYNTIGSISCANGGQVYSVPGDPVACP